MARTIDKDFPSTVLALENARIENANTPAILRQQVAALQQINQRLEKLENNFRQQRQELRDRDVQAQAQARAAWQAQQARQAQQAQLQKACLSILLALLSSECAGAMPSSTSEDQSPARNVESAVNMGSILNPVSTLQPPPTELARRTIVPAINSAQTQRVEAAVSVQQIHQQQQQQQQSAHNGQRRLFKFDRTATTISSVWEECDRYTRWKARDRFLGYNRSTEYTQYRAEERYVNNRLVIKDEIAYMMAQGISREEAIMQLNAEHVQSRKSISRFIAFLRDRANSRKRTRAP